MPCVMAKLGLIKVARVKGGDPFQSDKRQLIVTRICSRHVGTTMTSEYGEAGGITATGHADGNRGA